MSAELAEAQRLYDLIVDDDDLIAIRNWNQYCRANGITTEQMEAMIAKFLATQHEIDARLVDAADDMRDALERLLEYWDNGTPVHPGALIVEDARRALAKARGEAEKPSVTVV